MIVTTPATGFGVQAKDGQVLLYMHAGEPESNARGMHITVSPEVAEDMARGIRDEAAKARAEKGGGK